MLKTAIIGATGYTGLELVRLLLKHPQVEISVLTSERMAGQKFSEAFPQFQGQIDLTLNPLDAKKISSQIDFAFVCLPHQQAMDAVKVFVEAGVPVVDLSADFRLHQLDVYETWYGKHSAADLLSEATYGLPELHRSAIQKSKFIANPGCYPTSCILGLAPLLKEKLITPESIHCDAKSGASGAGRSAQTATLFCEVNEGLKAYKVGAHRHTPEIEQELSELVGQDITISFTPHLIPMDRGILATLYAQLKKSISSQALHQIYQKFYQDEAFVRLRPLGTFPSTADVRMQNYCDIGVHVDERTGRAVIISAIDNLTKGASGQAIQNMNLMMGFEETLGLL